MSVQFLARTAAACPPSQSVEWRCFDCCRYVSGVLNFFTRRARSRHYERRGISSLRKAGKQEFRRVQCAVAAAARGLDVYLRPSASSAESLHGCKRTKRSQPGCKPSRHGSYPLEYLRGHRGILSADDADFRRLFFLLAFPFLSSCFPQRLLPANSVNAYRA